MEYLNKINDPIPGHALRNLWLKYEVNTISAIFIGQLAVKEFTFFGT